MCRSGESLGPGHGRRKAKLARLDWRADLPEEGVPSGREVMVVCLYDMTDKENNHGINAHEGHLVAAAPVTAVPKYIPKGAEAGGSRP